MMTGVDAGYQSGTLQKALKPLTKTQGEQWIGVPITGMMETKSSSDTWQADKRHPLNRKRRESGLRARIRASLR